METSSIWDRVFSLAAEGRFGTSPNPRVGCVLTDAEGNPVAEGFHARAGEPHAEAVALAAAGSRARGATAWVNLEPCAHAGRTPPCAEALVAAGVARVFCSIPDPDPRTAGQGIARLREAGVEVHVGGEAVRAERLNEIFLGSVRLGRPFVHLRWAASLDGKIATESGHSQWITGEEARRHSRTLREEYDAILVGASTVLVDDPLLTRRLGLAKGILPHRRIVLDGRLRVSPEARIFNTPEAGETWIATAVHEEDHACEPFLERGVRVLSLRDPDGYVDLAALLSALGATESRSLLVEGGGETGFSFLTAGLVDRLTAYLAPILIGGAAAPSCLSGHGFSRLEQAPGLSEIEVEKLGEDLRVSGLIVRSRPHTAGG